MTITAAEAAERRKQGTDQTHLLSRIVAWIPWAGLVKWTATVIAGALIAGYISDVYSDKQREIELEARIATDISTAAVTLFQSAQEASRAVDAPNQREIRDQAADDWDLFANSISPILRSYYAESELPQHFSSYQTAMYDWAVLGCCTSPGRKVLVDGIRLYLETEVGPPNPDRPPPVDDPWRVLAESGSPDPALYQWVGYYLLKGRGALMADLQNEKPKLS